MNVSFGNAPLTQNILQRTSDATAVIRKQQSDVLSTTTSLARPVVLHGLDNVTISQSISQDELMTAFFGRADYSKYDYTKEDAVFFKNRAEKSTLRMDDEFLQKNASYIQGVKERTFFRSGSDEIAKSVDYIASVYAVNAERIRSSTNGSEMETQLHELDALMRTARQDLARDFADAVGDIFEENGVVGEKERLYQSVLAELDKKTAQYSEHIEFNKHYADISYGEEWLRKDMDYMAAELRRAVSGAYSTQMQDTSDFEGYTTDELQKMQVFSKELAGYSQSSSNSSNLISAGNETEESLGLKFAELTVKGKVFNDYAGVSEKVKNVIEKVIDGFVSTSIEKEHAYNELWMSRQIAAISKMFAEGREKGRPGFSEEDEAKEIAAVQKGFAAIDTAAIYTVINKVVDAYAQEGNAGKALTEGTIFAYNTYAAKLRDGRYTGVNRYANNLSYWNSFFTHPDNSSYQDAYVPKITGFESIINSYNTFVGHITSDRRAYMRETEFWANA